MRKNLAIIFILASMLIPKLLFGQAEYIAIPGTTKVAWDAVSYSLDHYEMTLIRDSGQTYVYTTTETQMVIPRPRSGKFTVRVRAVQADGTASPYCYSTDSSCSQLIDGSTSGAWKVSFRPSSVIGPLK